MPYGQLPPSSDCLGILRKKLYKFLQRPSIGTVSAAQPRDTGSMKNADFLTRFEALSLSFALSLFKGATSTYPIFAQPHLMSDV